ncbi:MAG: Glucose/sorbosone dehydrogenase-like protein [Frankiales bacterium]|nr:Glucose/sorbosone dehydrogenase-like protein [Frankiales bacterium]
MSAITRRTAFVSAVIFASAGLVPAGLVPAPASAANPRTVSVTFASAADAGFDAPTAVANAGDARLFVAEQSGLVRVVSGGHVAAKPYLDIRSLVTDGGERGLLGLAFHPSFATRPYVYVAYTRSNGSLQVSRFRAASRTAPTIDVSTRLSILNVPHPDAGNHNGGMLAFGADGLLYISTGDGGATPQRAQQLGSLLGKILRIDVNRYCGTKHYCVPSTNPFVKTTGARAEVFHLGLRNPWRFSFDRKTGSMWIGDVGQNAWEEIDRVGRGVGGKNFGWPCREGKHTYGGTCRSGTLTGPVDEYSHSLGCSITGGYVYRGTRQPLLSGVYVFADYCSGRVWGGTTVNGTWVRSQMGQLGGTVTAFGESASGELYVASGGRLLTVRASSA